AGVVGQRSVERFGPRLPYLLKVLAAGQPLSLQAHPSRAQAEDGFAREERDGIELSAPHRLYRDDWPKPEMMVALGNVDALCGFREPDQTYALFVQLGVAGATDLVAGLQAGGAEELRRVFGRVLSLAESDREVVAQVVTAAAEHLEAADGAGDPAFAGFTRTAVELDEHYPGDPGILAALLMNRLGFGRFQAVYLPAGNLHAYLHGIGVEIMANSDNVLRGGLTPKHVDVEELLTVVDFAPGVPDLVPVVAESGSVWRYDTPAPEFALWRIEPGSAEAVVPAPSTGRILLVVEGAVEITDASRTLRLGRGEAIYAYPGDRLTVRGDGVAVVAGPGLEVTRPE
ncbi:MAG: mannose-6-phosphate isomerase, class I, partial [Microlunatus sp.]|nr:mannose-6-phosphate isomerase, class I [Microlunatus sp.]